MSNEQERTDEEVFTAALALTDVADQNRYVSKTCADDDEQRDRILSLLQSHRQLAKVKTTFVLDRPDEVCHELMTEEPVSVGEKIGPYRVMQLLGEGGMGLVYQARRC